MSAEHNPYLPPASSSANRGFTPVATGPIVPAHKGRRFATFVIDYILFFALAFLIGFATVLLFGQEGAQSLQNIPDTVLGMIMFTAYYGFFEGIWGRTPGKLVCGTVVVNDDGGKPSFGQILGRTAARFIPFEFLSMFGKRPWHDSLSKTNVVMVRKP